MLFGARTRRSRGCSGLHRVEVVPGVTARSRRGASTASRSQQRGVSRSVVLRHAAGRRWRASVGLGKSVAAAIPRCCTWRERCSRREGSAVRAGLPRHPGRDRRERQPAAIGLYRGTLGLPQLAARIRGGPALLLVGQLFAALQARARDLAPRSANQSA
jgi:hypothetical protein